MFHASSYTAATRRLIGTLTGTALVLCSTSTESAGEMLWAVPISSITSVLATTPQPDSLLLGPVVIHHSDGRTQEQQGIVVAHGRIKTTGSWEDLQRRYARWPQIPAPAQHVYPGWIDAHTHFLAWGLGATTVDLTGTQNWDECLQRLDAFTAKHPQQTLVFGRGWDQNDWPNSALPPRASWENRYPNRTVVLTRVDGHAALAVGPLIDPLYRKNANGPYAVTGGTVDPTTGLFLDRATEVLPVFQPSRSDKIAALKRAEQDAYALGITSVHEAGLPTEDLLLLDSLHRTGSLQMPIYGMVSDRPADRRYWRHRTALKTDRLSVRSFKFYADGALGSRGALLRTPYADAPHTHGLQLYPLRHFERGAREMLRKGWQMNTHAIGDSANGMLLSLYGRVLEDATQSNHRWRIEHAQLLSDPDVAALGRLRVLPSVQPCHATSDLPWAGERLGPDRLAALGYRYAALAAASPVLPMGTDVPVEPLDPRRTWEAGRNAGLTDAQILKGMTHDAAYAGFEENERGSIAPGFWASFTFFQQPVEEQSTEKLLQIPVQSTWVHGVQVYLRHVENRALPPASVH